MRLCRIFAGHEPSVLIHDILRDECPLKSEPMKMFGVTVVWMWSLKHVSLCLFTNINQTVCLSILPLISVWNVFFPHCHRPELPHLSLPSASPSCDSVGVVLYDEIWREVTVDEMERHYPIMINKRKRRQRNFQNVILEIFIWPQSIIHFPQHLAAWCFILSPIKNSSVVLVAVETLKKLCNSEVFYKHKQGIQTPPILAIIHLHTVSSMTDGHQAWLLGYFGFISSSSLTFSVFSALLQPQLLSSDASSEKQVRGKQHLSEAFYQ